MLGFGIIELFILLIALPLSLAAFAFWIWMIIDCVQKEEGSNKIAWVLVVVLLHFLGALIYFFARRLQRKY